MNDLLDPTDRRHLDGQMVHHRLRQGDPSLIIEGCRIPLNLYRTARSVAVTTGRCQFIGVLYDASFPHAHAEGVLTWPTVTERLSAMRADLMNANGTTFVLADRNSLQTLKDVITIIWITPQAEEE
jgi:hypothetical protein